MAATLSVSQLGGPATTDPARLGCGPSSKRFEASRMMPLTFKKLLRADQLAQPIRLTAPGVPIVVELFADQLTNPEQPFDLLLH
jgi:hypothetical protein